MVTWWGVFSAAVRAVEVLDGCLGRVCKAVQSVQGECLITADHGNVEHMHDADRDQPHTAHTCAPVPLIYIGARALEFAPGDASLADIAPTLLCLGDVRVPADMEGRVLLRERGGS